MDRNLALEVVRVTEAAALACSRLMGRGDRDGADRLAVEAMRRAFETVRVRGTVVIGEGERDEAPMLYIGEQVGTGWRLPAEAQDVPRVDIAVDPLEGTNLCATGSPGAIAVIALAQDGKFLNAPDTYMDKIACGPGYPAGTIDLDLSPAENVKRLAEARGVASAEITVCILDRPRHAELIASARSAGARVYLITDGDVAGVINTADPATGVDLYVGQGGAPEGVLACAALKCVGGQFQGRLVFRNADERRRAERVGITDFDKKYDLDEVVRADAIFAATGVTKGALLDGVTYSDGFVRTHSLVMNSSTRTVREVRMKRAL